MTDTRLTRRGVVAGLLGATVLPAHAQKFAIFQAQQAGGGGGGGLGTPQLQVAGMFATTNAAFTTDQVQNYYVPGNESPAISTAEYYHSGALLCMRPWDLDTMGAPGASVKAANGGNRYVWISSFDHPAGGLLIHSDGWGLLIGFSNDPGVFPSVMINAIAPTAQFTGDATTPGANGITVNWDFVPSALVYNPDDASFPFYLYVQGGGTVSTGQVMWKSTNLFDWQGGSWGPIVDLAFAWNPTNSFQYVTRRGVNDWIATGIGGTYGRSGSVTYTSMDGKTWDYSGVTSYNGTGDPSMNLSIDAGSGTPNRLTAASAIFSSADTGKMAVLYNGAAAAGFLIYQQMTYVSSTQVDLTSFYPANSDWHFPPTPSNSFTFTSEAAPFQYGPAMFRAGPGQISGPVATLSIYGANGDVMNDPFQVGNGSQLYQMAVEDARHVFQSTDNGLWVTAAPIDSGYNVDQVVTPVRFGQYSGVYPGPGYLQELAAYNEDGIVHVYAENCYPGPHNTGTAPFPGANVTGQINGATLTVDSLVGSVGIVPLGGFVTASQDGGFNVATIVSGPGTTGTYVVTNPDGWAFTDGTTPQMSVGSATNVIGTLSGTSFVVSSLSGTISPADVVNLGLGVLSGQITGFGTGSGGAGTYTIDNYGVVTPAHQTGIIINAGAAANTSNVGGTIANGCIGHQFIDYYTMAYDSVAASDAAPFGVAASCNNNTVTISWTDTPLGTGAKSQSYNVYRGTSSSSQTTLVGNTSSLSMTDTPTAGSVYWYKVVKVSGGVETKNRVVHTYVG